MKPIIPQNNSPREHGSADQPLAYVSFERNWLNPETEVRKIMTSY